MYRELHGDPFYVRMQRKATDMYRELETASGRTLLRPCPVYFFGSVASGKTVQGGLVDSIETAKLTGIPHRVLATPESLEAEVPVEIERDWIGVASGNGGVIISDQVLLAYEGLLQKRGWTVARGEAVGVRLGDEGAPAAPGALPAAPHVVSFKPEGAAPVQRFATWRICLCAGAWSQDALALLGRTSALEAWRMHWGHVKVAEPFRAKVPIWYQFGKAAEGDQPDAGLFYGFPAEEGADCVKIGLDFAEPGSCRAPVPKREWFAAPDPSMQRRADEYFNARLKGIDGPVELQCNPYSMSPDCEFVLDTLPDLKGVSIFAGDSGRAFKFVPLLGRLLAEKTLGKSNLSFDASKYKVDRDVIKYRTISKL